MAKRFYDTYEGPDGVNAWHPLAERALARDLEAGHVLAEFGCGSGSFLSALCARYGVQGVGLDYSPRNVARVASRGLEAIQADFEGRLPVADNRFDAAVCLEVVEHLIDPRNLLREINRTMKRGAPLCITTPNAFNIRRRIAYVLGYHHDPLMDPARSDFAEHLRAFSFESLGNLATQAGFRVERSTGDRIPDGRYPLSTRLRALLSSHVCLLMRKT